MTFTGKIIQFNYIMMSSFFFRCHGHCFAHACSSKHIHSMIFECFKAFSNPWLICVALAYPWEQPPRRQDMHIAKKVPRWTQKSMERKISQGGSSKFTSVMLNRSSTEPDSSILACPKGTLWNEENMSSLLEKLVDLCSVALVWTITC